METVNITLTRDELDTILTGLHYGMNWLRNIEMIDTMLDDEELEEYSNILQEVWEMHDLLLYKANLTAETEV